ncbi:MAG: SdpI family protein [Clostridia bacterium]|nr:SdpI family protein [Clostridia bacterium]
MIKNNKLTLVFSSAVILLPAVVGVILWDKLPDTMATHWNAAGESDGFGSKAFAVFGFPLIILALHWLCVFFTEKDPKNKNQSPKMQKIVLWICPVLTLIASGAIYFTALGKEINPMMIMPIILGVMFVVLGNYMPKCKQNYTMGIKVKWALENETNWNKTHRFGGILWFFCGLIMLVAAFLPHKYLIPVMVAVLSVSVLAPVVYSYAVYRKMQKNGELTEENKAEPFSGMSKPLIVSTIIITVVLVFVLVFALIVLPVTGNVEVVCTENTLEISSEYWSDISVSYSDIDEITLRDDVDSGRRTNGFGTPRLLLGTFENEEFGRYTRYTYGKCDACIVIKDGENVLVINAADETSTQALYEEILSKK